MRTRTFVLAFVFCGLFACGGGGDEEGEGGETTEASDPSSTLVLDVEGVPLCGANTDRLEFATRRVACWDPEVPCTSPAVPPWITGTVRSCADMQPGNLRWDVTVTGTGQYETQLRALTSDDMQEGINCYAAGAEDLTRIANVDLDEGGELFVSEIPDNQCTNP